MFLALTPYWGYGEDTSAPRVVIVPRNHLEKPTASGSGRQLTALRRLIFECELVVRHDASAIVRVLKKHGFAGDQPPSS